MDLLEYQAKELFHQVGIPVLPSQCIFETRELKNLHIPYPVVLKSQVKGGGRARAGGIRFVENTIDAIAAARTIFNLPILNEYPQVLLAEARYNAEQELFLAVILDYQKQRPVLLGSASGGVNVEALLLNMQTVVVEDDFSLFYARRLAILMGLQGDLIQLVSLIIAKMYHLFETKDLELIEINPLGINADNQLMALDGKITIHDHALSRHPDILELINRQTRSTSVNLTPLILGETSVIPQPKQFPCSEEKGNMAIITNGLGLALNTWDLCLQQKGKLSSCWIIGQDTQPNTNPREFIAQQLEQVLDEILDKPENHIIFLNFLLPEKINQSLAEVIIKKLNNLLPKEDISLTQILNDTPTNSPVRPRKTRINPPKNNQGILPTPRFIIRLVGTSLNTLKENITYPAIFCTESLEQSLQQITLFSKEK